MALAPRARRVGRHHRSAPGSARLPLHPPRRPRRRSGRRRSGRWRHLRHARDGRDQREHDWTAPRVGRRLGGGTRDRGGAARAAGAYTVYRTTLVCAERMYVVHALPTLYKPTTYLLHMQPGLLPAPCSLCYHTHGGSSACSPRSVSSLARRAASRRSARPRHASSACHGWRACLSATGAATSAPRRSARSAAAPWVVAAAVAAAAVKAAPRTATWAPRAGWPRRARLGTVAARRRAPSACATPRPPRQYWRRR